MTEFDPAQFKPWIGDPPRVEPPEVPGYEMLLHARVDMLQLSIAGVILLPLWWFVFAGLVQWLSGGAEFHIHVGVAEIVLGVLIAMVLVPLIHEAAHGLTAQLLGARPSYGVGPGFAYTTFREPMGSLAYLAVGLAPLLVVGVAGVLLAVWWPAGRGWLIFACIVNASGAIGDLWMSWRIVRMPRRTIYFDLADGFAAFVPTTVLSRPPTQTRPARPE